MPTAPPTEAPQQHHVRRAGSYAAASPYSPARLLKGAVIEAGRTLQQAGEALANAQTQAARIVADAEAQCQQARDEARAAALAEARAGLTRMLGELRTRVASAEERFARDAVEGAFEIARAILHIELELRPQHLMDLVKTALGEARRQTTLRLAMNPADAPAVRQALPEASIAPWQQLEIIEDPQLARFELRLDTEMGVYRVGLASALDRLRQHVLAQGEHHE